jgi:hypothetical protein
MTVKSFDENKVVFVVEHSMKRHGCTDGAYLASLEVIDGQVSFLIDDSEYCFTAQQCAEVSKSLAKMLLTNSNLGICEGSAESISRLATYATWYQLIQSRTLSTKRDSLQICESRNKGFEFCASGSFRRPEFPHCEPDYYKLVIALDDDLDLPCLGIDDRTFRLNFEEAFWLVEQLWVAGYLAAQIEQPTVSTVNAPYIDEDGHLICY